MTAIDSARPGQTEGDNEHLLLEVSDHVASLTFNRPAKLNTVTAAMGRALLNLVEQINRDDEVRVVVLTGAGPRAFCAGTDVGGLDDYGTNWQLRNRADYASGILRIRKPVIAKVRGYCLGSGLEMALMSDIRYADPTAKFGAPEVKLGWAGGAGGVQLLPRVARSGTALEMLFSGDPIDAEEALRTGLVDRVLPPEDLDTAVDDLAARIASRAPIAVQMAKHLFRVSQSAPLEVGLAYENDAFVYCMATEDAAEGRAAFAEKRPPLFRGQ